MNKVYAKDTINMVFLTVLIEQGQSGQKAIKKVQRSGAEINAQHIEDGNNCCFFNGFRFKSDGLQGLTLD